MELLHKALVIKVPINGHGHYIFFTEKYGTLVVRLYKTVKARTLTRGALVFFAGQEQANFYRCDSVEVIATPAAWVIEHLRFLHHVLEVIDFFMPRNVHAENIFQLLQLLYQKQPVAIDVPLLQKLFLGKLFIMIGIYPEPRTHDDALLIALFGGESNYDPAKYVFLEKKMIQWLQDCIRLHPQADQFKTKLIEP